MRKTANIKADKNNSATVIYSYFEKGCRKKCARDKAER